MNTKTKLVLTCNSFVKTYDIMQMIKMGVRAFRFNSAHLNRLQLIDLFNRVMLAAKLTQQDPEIFVDLPGNKTRIWYSEEERLTINPGDVLKIKKSSKPINNKSLQINNPNFFLDATQGDMLVVNRRGKLFLEVRSSSKRNITAVSLSKGIIGWGYHIYIDKKYRPNNELSLQDKVLLPAIIYGNPDYICPSFVDSPAIVTEIRRLIRKNKLKSKILAKIESPDGVNNLEIIAEVADGIVIGRDDLHAWFDDEMINNIATDIITLCKKKNKISVPASNYFSGLKETIKLTEQNIKDLDRTLQYEPNYLYCNETQKNDDWKKYVISAQEFKLLEI